MKFLKLKKMLAVVLAATMVCAPMTALADESLDGATSAGGEYVSNGKVEGFVNKDVFRVILPTTTNDTLKFKLDPQGLLSIASSSTYTLGSGAVYFTNGTGSPYTYSKESDAITIANKSSYDVDVKFSVNVTLPTGITLVNSEAALANATTPSLYLGMKEVNTASGGQYTALTSGTNDYATVTLDKVAENEDSGYWYFATATGSAYDYDYDLVDDFDDSTADKAEYKITGKCDNTADWSNVTTSEVTLKVVWSAVKKGGSVTSGPSIETTTYTATKGSPVNVTVDLGDDNLAATGIAKVLVKGTTTEIPTARWSFANNVLTFDATYVTNNWDTIGTAAGRELTVVFNDTNNTTVDILIKSN